VGSKADDVMQQYHDGAMAVCDKFLKDHHEYDEYHGLCKMLISGVGDRLRVQHHVGEETKHQFDPSILHNP
jgi:hypothetical protein